MTISSEQIRPSLGASRKISPVSESVPLSFPIVLTLFMLAATQPYGIQIGPLLIGPYRLILLLAAPVLLIQWISGKYGRIILPDILVLAHALWLFVSLIVNGDTGRLVEYGGAQFVDTFIAYLLGRAAIRTREDFYFFARLFLLVLLLMLPFAVIESAGGVMILIPLAEKLPLLNAFPRVTLEYEPRLGLRRAQVGSAHPILFGVMCSMAFSFAMLSLAHGPRPMGFVRRVLFSAGSWLGTFFSLSAGAILSLLIQGILIVYNSILRGWRARWTVMAVGAVMFYTLVALVAERPPALVIGRLISFSGSTAWNRYMIWQFGSEEVMRHPIFGMGLFYEWVRAPWMPQSIDNQWLLITMRFGIPSIALFFGAMGYVVYRLIRMKTEGDQALDAIRMSFVFVFLALFASYSTVAAWHFQWALLLFLIGAAAWIFQSDPIKPGDSPSEDQTESTPAKTLSYSRFARKQEKQTALEPRPPE